MRKLIAIATLLGLMFSAATALAEVKIAYVNMQEVIAKSEPGQAARATLKDKFNDMKSEMEKKKKEIESLRDELQKQGFALSQDARQEKELEFKRKVRDFQDTSQVYQQNIKEEEERLSKPILEDLQKIIGEFGEKKGYTAIFDSRMSGMLYADDGIEVTNEIIVELNKAWRKKK